MPKKLLKSSKKSLGKRLFADSTCMKEKFLDNGVILNAIQNLKCQIFFESRSLHDFPSKEKGMATSQQLTIKEQIEVLEPLYAQLLMANDFLEKLRIIETNPFVKEFLQSSKILAHHLAEMDSKNNFVIKAVLAIGQGTVIFHGIEAIKNISERLKTLSEALFELESFYSSIGGIVGYHCAVLELIYAKGKPKQNKTYSVKYEKPLGIDLSKDTQDVRLAVRWGIEHMAKIAEIYPVGGAGDRLNLKDASNGQLLPAAQLNFCGRTLLEGLIRDLQGREFLHYKLFNRQLMTPLALMTSHEKNNHNQVLNICKKNKWFGRLKDSFAFFIQGLVPMVTIDGKWAAKAPLELILKPGGHGVIWKTAQDKGIFVWLEKQNRTKALVRQINNPLAGIDNGLLSLAGIGCQKNKEFGFASCDRLLNTAEGMDVLCEKKFTDHFEYSITNIEYTDFEQQGVKDEPIEPGSPYSRFPSNTNILFVDLKAIQNAIEHCPFPGRLINMKNTVACRENDGSMVEQYAGRLETTMQNIADFIVDKFPKPLVNGQNAELRSFLTYNKRRKTISVTKQAYKPGKSLVGTPEGCFYELLENYHDLLTNYCQMQIPTLNAEQEYISQGPSFLVDFHPALGPLFEVIGQKIRGGRLHAGSEWIMEIAEAEIGNLELEGSLLIEADSIMGKRDASDVITYDSAHCGKCTLIDVKVKNKGVKPSGNNVFWKSQITREESLHITIQGNGEFFAQGVTFDGNFHFQVSDGYRLTAYKEGSEIRTRSEKLDRPTWQWNYQFDQENRITLKKNQQKIKP